MTKVEIVNLALGWLAEDRVSDLDADPPESPRADLAARFYDTALRSTLEAKAWTFATRWETVDTIEASDVPDMPWRAALPSTVVRVLEADDGSGLCDIAWRREGGYVLLADEIDEVRLQVVHFEEDPTKYSPGFERALAARLAADLVGPLTERQDLVVAMERRFQAELVTAGARDGKQGSVQARRSSWWRTARGG